MSEAVAAAPEQQSVAPVAETPTEAAPQEPQQPEGLEALREKLGLKKPEPAPAEEKPEPQPNVVKVDPELAANLAHLAKLDRQLKAQRAAFEAERQSFEAQKLEAERVVAARAKWKEGKRLDAFRDTFGELSLDDVVELSKEAGADPKPLTAEDFEKLYQERRQREEAAAKEAAEKASREREERISQKEASLVGTVGEFLSSNAEKYPTLMFRGVAGEKVVQLLREGFQATGAIPSAELVCDYLEDLYRKEATEKLAPILAPPAEKKPMRTFGAADKRGAALTAEEKPVEPPKMTLEERKRRFLAEKIKPLDARSR